MLVKYTTENRIASIIINRPEKRNALNPELVSELTKAFDKAEKDVAIKVIILKATGDVFSAGADLEYLKELQQNSFDENLTDSNRLKKLFQKIYQHPKIVIAQVEGHAIAGGCGLVSVCDFIFATPETKFGYTEVKIGFIPAIVSLFLIRRIGEGFAKQLLLTGNLITAEKALQIGLVNELYSQDTIENEVKIFAENICTTTSLQSVALTKQLINKVQQMNLSDALNWASEMNAHARATDDCKKGIQAFINKQKINW